RQTGKVRRSLEQRQGYRRSALAVSRVENRRTGRWRRVAPPPDRCQARPGPRACCLRCCATMQAARARCRLRARYPRSTARCAAGAAEGFAEQDPRDSLHGLLQLKAWRERLHTILDDPPVPDLDASLAAAGERFVVSYEDKRGAAGFLQLEK